MIITFTVTENMCSMMAFVQLMKEGCIFVISKGDARFLSIRNLAQGVVLELS